MAVSLKNASASAQEMPHKADELSDQPYNGFQQRNMSAIPDQLLPLTSLHEHPKSINTVFVRVEGLPDGVDLEDLLFAFWCCHVDLKTFLGFFLVNSNAVPGGEASTNRAFIWLRNPQEMEWLVTRAHGKRPWLRKDPCIEHMKTLSRSQFP